MSNLVKSDFNNIEVLGEFLKDQESFNLEELKTFDSLIIPHPNENQNIGLARATAFIIYCIKDSQALLHNRDFTIDYSSHEITIEPPSGDSYKYNYESSKYAAFLFLYFKEVLDDKHAHDSSFEERIYRSASTILDLFNFDLKIQENLVDLIDNFYEQAAQQDMGIIKKFEKSLDYKSKDLVSTKDGLMNILKFLRMNSNFGILGNCRARKALLGKQYHLTVAYKFLKLSVFETTDIRLAWMNTELASKEETIKEFDKNLNLTKEAKKALSKKVLSLINANDDSIELANFIKSKKNKIIWSGFENIKASSIYIYSYSEINSITEDSAYKPYRINKTVKEFNESLSNEDTLGELSKRVLKVSAKDVIETLPQMGEYFVDQVSQEQKDYVNVLIRTLANRLESDTAEHALDSKIIKTHVETAEKLVKDARAQNEQSSLIYGRQASHLFLNLTERKIEIMEAADKQVIIENGKRIDNILINLIIGFARF